MDRALLKRALLLIAGVAAVSVIVLFRSLRAPDSAPVAPSETRQTADESPAGALEPPVESETTAQPAAAALTTPNLALPSSPALLGSAELELDPVRTLIRDYRLAHQGNPVGNNAEITAALREARLLPAPGFVVNDAGELVDRWGTPYFFHQISGEQMEIRSAGPDRQMWNGDDLVVP